MTILDAAETLARGISNTPVALISSSSSSEDKPSPRSSAHQPAQETMLQKFPLRNPEERRLAAFGACGDAYPSTTMLDSPAERTPHGAHDRRATTCHNPPERARDRHPDHVVERDRTADRRRQHRGHRAIA